LDKAQKKRRAIQAGFAAITNSNVYGLVSGSIYRGKLKALCVPGLNCYSCPASVASCPMGALQAVLSNAGYYFSFYVYGYLIIAGMLFGRLVCGFLCPFGLLQELLHKAPARQKPKEAPKYMKFLRSIKYFVLAFAIILPIAIPNAAGGGQPWFCKLICPAGTLQAGIPLLILNSALRKAAGFLFSWKLAILAATLILSTATFRPFCKYACPLGAIYAMLNKVSLYSYSIDGSLCTNCMECSRICPMQANIRQNPNSAECIRCGACKDACKTKAISSGYRR